MATTDVDPCAQARETLNTVEQELMAHRAAHGEADDEPGAGWGEERRRLLDAVSAAIVSYEDCIRAHDPQLIGRPELAEDFAAMSRMRNREGALEIDG